MVKDSGYVVVSAEDIIKTIQIENNFSYAPTGTCFNCDHSILEVPLSLARKCARNADFQFVVQDHSRCNKFSEEKEAS